MKKESPSNVMVSPNRNLSGYDLDDIRYQQQLGREQSVIDAAIKEKKERDAIGTLLGSNFFTTDKSWPWLKNQAGVRVNVSRWYPALATAVDIFRVIDEETEREIGLKRRLFKEQGIRYGALDWSMSIDQLVTQTGIPEIQKAS